MKVCLDLHDFSVTHNRLGLLLRLKEKFPAFKVSLFTIPIDDGGDWGPSLIRSDYLSEIKKYLDWLQLIPHGLSHNRSEALAWDYPSTMGFVIPTIKKAFDSDGLPFVDGFCAPHWRWSEGVVKALDDSGWWGAVDRDKVMPTPKKFYKYNLLLNEPFNTDLDVLKLHGHVYGTKNDLGRCFNSLMNLPSSTEFSFVTEHLEDK